MNARHRLAFTLAGSALLALSSQPLSAQSPPNNVQCFIVSNMFAKAASEEKTRQVAGQARFFYLGRLSGTSSQIEAAISAQAKGITPQKAGPLMQACARSMAQKAAQVQGIGERLAKAQVNKGR